MHVQLKEKQVVLSPYDLCFTACTWHYLHDAIFFLKHSFCRHISSLELGFSCVAFQFSFLAKVITPCGSVFGCVLCEFEGL